MNAKNYRVREKMNYFFSSVNGNFTSSVKLWTTLFQGEKNKNIFKCICDKQTCGKVLKLVVTQNKSNRKIIVAVR